MRCFNCGAEIYSRIGFGPIENMCVDCGAWDYKEWAIGDYFEGVARGDTFSQYLIDAERELRGQEMTIRCAKHWNKMVIL
jgi:hypothetical protein